VQLFKHGYEGYMRYAYPAVCPWSDSRYELITQDELRPLTCGPLGRDPDIHNYGINDIHANISITLIDVLSTLPILHPSAFPEAVQKAAEISFDQDVKVQVFEMTIRALGALLSTYQLLDKLPDDHLEQAKVLGLSGWSWRRGVDVKRYKGRMLELALDLGERMLPAFATPTGLPYARINLRHGVEKGESQETCEACGRVR
jgi:mannosidase alpha-like ER degradation enhancer 1